MYCATKNANELLALRLESIFNKQRQRSVIRVHQLKQSAEKAAWINCVKLQASDCVALVLSGCGPTRLKVA